MRNAWLSGVDQDDDVDGRLYPSNGGRMKDGE
jgi:hypothetical protein